MYVCIYIPTHLYIQISICIYIYSKIPVRSHSSLERVWFFSAFFVSTKRFKKTSFKNTVQTHFCAQALCLLNAASKKQQRSTSTFLHRHRVCSTSASTFLHRLRVCSTGASTRLQLFCTGYAFALFGTPLFCTGYAFARSRHRLFCTGTVFAERMAG